MRAFGEGGPGVKAKLRPVLLLALVCAAGGGLWLWRSQRAVPPGGRLILYGNVDIRQVELAVNASERIAALLAEEGDRVVTGQLLARLETEGFELSVQRAEAQAENQRQVVARLEAGTRPEEIRKARADAAAAEAALAEAENAHRRVSALAPLKAVSLQSLDDARAARDSARARLKAAGAVLDLAVAGPRREDIAAARALSSRYEAELALERKNLRDAFLHSPCDGVVQNRILEVGDMASPQRPVFTLALVDPLWVRAYVSEPDLGKIREGMPAAVTTDSFPDRCYEGRVGFISPTAEFTPKPVETAEVRTRLVYQVRVFVRDPRGELRLGMPATVTLDPERGSREGDGAGGGSVRGGGNG